MNEPNTLEMDPAGRVEEALVQLGVGLRVLERATAAPYEIDRADELLLTTLALDLDRLARDTRGLDLTPDQEERLAGSTARVKAVIETLARREEAAATTPAVAVEPRPDTAHASSIDSHSTAPGSIPQLTRSKVLRTTGRALMVTGSVLILFFVYELVFTGFSEARSQRALLPRFRAALRTGQLDALNRLPASGAPVALLEIPHIGVSQVVVQGSSPEQLKDGPGHLMDTSLPGEYGNAVIIGHRSTYGAPFRHLDELQTGDRIIAITGKGAFTYSVSRTQSIAPGLPDVIGPSYGSSLTLVTSGDAILPSDRFAVVAKLVGRPVGIPTRPSLSVAPDEMGTTGNVTGAFIAFLWGLALIGAILLAVALYRRWPAKVAYVVTTPIVVLLLILIFENLDRVLPGTL